MPAFVKPPGGDKPAPHPIDVMIGLKIQGRRLQLGLTLEELAAKLGTTKQTISSYEQGRLPVTIVRLYRISRLLDVTTDWFLKSLETIGGPDAG